METKQANVNPEPVAPPEVPQAVHSFETPAAFTVTTVIPGGVAFTVYATTCTPAAPKPRADE